MKKSKDKSNSNGMEEISRSRKIAFNIIFLSLTILIFVLFEFGLRILNYGKDLRVFLESENYPGYYEINRDVNLRYFNKIVNTSPTNDIFLIEKPDTSFRIFVFGGSTTRGFPYQASTSFPRILYYQLQDIFPDKRIEMVNLSASAINSYTYIDMLGEVLKNEPDAILVYGGHNEYYGALGVGSVEMGGNFRWIKKLRLKLCRLRSYQLVQNIITKIGSGRSKNENSNGATLMARIVKDKDIAMNSKLYNRGIDQYRDNMTELVRKAGKKDVPVILSELVSNISDQAPFKSIEVDNLPAAMSIYQEAMISENNGDIETAKDLYYRAKDLDVIRFRAPEALNGIIHELAEKYSLPLVPMIEHFEAKSENRIIGKELMLEHLHPNIEGDFIMANAFATTLNKSGLIAKSWDENLIKPIEEYRNNWGFTELDSLIGDLNVKYLRGGWPFKHEDEANRFVESYRYTSYVDSMAFAYITEVEEDMHIEDEHIKLALYYSKNGRPDKAFDEYYAIIKEHPYVADLYYDASKYLISQRKFREALDLIYSAPNMERDYFYHYMLGTLQIKLSMLDQATNNLERAYSIITKDVNPMKVLAPLLVAYREKEDSENQERILGLIKQIDPEFGKTNEQERRTLANTDVTYEDVLSKAKQLLASRQFENAEKLLLSLNRVEVTFESCKLLGSAYLAQNQIDQAFIYCQKAYDLDPKDALNTDNLYILNLYKADINAAAKLLDELRFLDLKEGRLKQLEDAFENRINELESK